MATFKANRINLGGVTYELDNPIEDQVFYVTTRRKSQEEAIESLINNGYLKPVELLKRQKIREDTIIKALKAVGSLLIP